MQTRIHPDLKDLPKVQEAERILRSCVHCGFCTATCPTYQLLGDELDGPRGRIYLIKNLLEENAIDDRVVVHLDRCLICRACETSCPSGVKYSRLLEIVFRAITCLHRCCERGSSFVLFYRVFWQIKSRSGKSHCRFPAREPGTPKKPCCCYMDVYNALLPPM